MILPKKGDLYSDKAGKPWKVLNVGRTTVEAVHKKIYKRPFGLGTWLEEFEPFGCEQINQIMEG